MASYTTLRVGSRGDEVKKLQKALGIEADGIYGQNTAAAVKQYQKKNGLTVDGIAGNNTLGSLYSTKTTNTNKSNKTNKDTKETTNPTFKGVDQKYVDIAYQDYTPSGKETEYLDSRNKYGQMYEDKVAQGFQLSDTVQQAFTWLDGQLDYFKNGKTSWDDKITSQLAAIENREEFEYDVDNDQLFQQALASAMKSGQTAMQDTIGQASALTGGYGSTYATSAGNQAYNSFIEDAYNNLPEYYQMALSTYQAEGEEMYRLLNAYTQMGETEWNRAVDSYNLVSDYANNERNFEYGAYQDDLSNLYNVMDMYGSFYTQENAEGMTKWQQQIENAWNTIGQQSSDYWSQTNFDEEVRQFDKTFNAEYTSDGKGGYVKKSNNGGSGSDGEYKTPTQTQKQGALEAYNTGGETAYYQYLDGLPSDIDVEEIDTYVMGNDESKGYGQLPHSQRTYEVIDDGGNNWLWGVDNNAKVKDQYGNEYTLKQLAEYDKDLAKELSKKEYTVGSKYTKK